MLPGMMAPAVPPRAPFVTDFREYAVASDLNDNGWTNSSFTNFTCLISSDGTSLGGKKVTIDKTVSDGGRFMLWLMPPYPLNDFEILTRIKLNGVPSPNGGTTGQIAARVTDTDEYYVALPRKSAGGSTKQFEIGKETGAGGVVALDNLSLTWDDTNYWWIRFQGISTALKARMWQHGTAEPTTWQNEATDSAHSGGTVGYAAFLSSDLARYESDFFSVAMDGKTAPGPSG